MKPHAVFLHVARAEHHSLKHEKLLEPQLQASMVNRALCGFGKTEDEALEKAIDWLTKLGILESFECNACVDEILQRSHSSEDAIRHFWIIDKIQYGKKPVLHALPHHDTLVEFCDRHNLSEEAQQELASFFDASVFLRKRT